MFPSGNYENKAFAEMRYFVSRLPFTLFTPPKKRLLHRCDIHVHLESSQGWGKC